MLLISPEVFWPRTSRAVLGFSLSLGSRFLRKRRALDVFAVLESTIRTANFEKGLSGGLPNSFFIFLLLVLLALMLSVYPSFLILSYLILSYLILRYQVAVSS